MFLDLIRRRNPTLIEHSIALHQVGKLPPNTYVIDLDAVEQNARHIHLAAGKLGLKVYAMTKQVGRNANFCEAVARGGISKAVAVDMECARATHRAGLALGHIGHLVQVPRFQADAASSMSPDYWTVFSSEKAHEAAAAALKNGRRQSLLARIVSKNDKFYRGHEGGFSADDVVEVAEALNRVSGGHFAGITSFPTLLLDKTCNDVRPTPNLRTLCRAAENLIRSGVGPVEINAPGTTSAEVLPLLAEAGATQIEPGHGLTGTTPLHALRDLPETPAIVYLSEISHFYGKEAFCFGGGLYIDPVFPDYQVRAIVSREPTVAAKALAPVEIPSPASIDYYGMVDVSGLINPRAGDSVVFGFRPQAFVTRAYVAGIRGSSTGNPTVQSICDASGRSVSWPL